MLQIQRYVGSIASMEGAPARRSKGIRAGWQRVLQTLNGYGPAVDTAVPDLWLRRAGLGSGGSVVRRWRG